jgi:hypothetical protein
MALNDREKRIRDLHSNIMGADVLESIKNERCASCGGPAAEFEDAVSSVEYLLSGLCQKCQDEVFCPNGEK